MSAILAAFNEQRAKQNVNNKVQHQVVSDVNEELQTIDNGVHDGSVTNEPEDSESTSGESDPTTKPADSQAEHITRENAEHDPATAEDGTAKAKTESNEPATASSKET